MLWWGMGGTVNGLNWLRHFINQHLPCPLQGWNPFQCPSLYSGATCVYRANQPLRKKLSDFPGGAADGSLPANGGDRILSQTGKDSTCMGGEGGCSSASAAQLLSPPSRASTPHPQRRGRPQRVPKYCKEEWPQLATTGESPHNATRTPA